VRALAIVLVALTLEGCVTLPQPAAFRDVRDRCWIVISNRAELVDEAWCSYAGIDRKHHTTQ
jgi:type IV pilus biogenesis protein CpaD/CtpE